MAWSSSQLGDREPKESRTRPEIVSDRGRRDGRGVKEKGRPVTGDGRWKLAAGRRVHMSPGVETSFYTRVQQHSAACPSADAGVTLGRAPQEVSLLITPSSDSTQETAQKQTTPPQNNVKGMIAHTQTVNHAQEHDSDVPLSVTLIGRQAGLQ